jgi:hypothetical protein
VVSDSPGLFDQAKDSESSGHRGIATGLSSLRFGTRSTPDLPAGEFLCGQWIAACVALAVPAGHTGWSVRTLQALLPAWALEAIGSAPADPSYVADDGFPAEMSVNWSGSQPELRLLFDSLGDSRFDVVSTTAATRRWGQIHRIFAQRSDVPAAPLWYSVAWRPPATMVHKTYFGLYAWPLAQRYAAVDEAMAELGMSAAWADARRYVDDAVGQREIEFLAVDLADRADARVKIYYRNHGADLGEMNRIASVARCHDPERALAAYKTLAGDRADAGEAALTCLAFRAGLTQVAESTTYLRLADLAPNDDQAVDRTAALLSSEGIDPARLRTLVTALASRPLEDSQGLLALVSYRAAGRRGDVTTYFRFPVYGRA